MDLEISNRKIIGKSPKYLDLNSTIFSNPWVKREIKRQNRKYF